MVASRHLDVMPGKDVAVWPARHLCSCLIVASGDPENVEELDSLLPGRYTGGFIPRGGGEQGRTVRVSAEAEKGEDHVP